jgi:hypothetical protein
MTDKTEAMDNLIAQDADLIEICPDDLVQRLRRTYRKEYAPTGSTIGNISNRLRPFPILATEVLFNPDGRAAAERIESQAAEIERLRKALQFYADAKNWAYVKSAGCNCVDADSGDTARAALEQSKW